MTTKAIISKVDWDTIFATAKPDKNNSNALNVSVSCAKIFQKEIIKYENDVVINVKHARIYPNKIKSDTNYFKANAYCTKCKVTYSIIIKNERDIEANYVNLLITRDADHFDHNALKKDKKQQIRGEAREEMKQELKLSGQTVKDFRFEMIAQNKPIEDIPSEEVLRQMSYEDKHKFDLAKDWRDNLIATSITSQTHLRGHNINGFVRKIVVEQDFAMFLHCQEQVDSVKSVPKQFRVLHTDATGNLVNIPKYKRDYPQILSHFLMMKDLREIGKKH